MNFGFAASHAKASGSSSRIFQLHPFVQECRLVEVLAATSWNQGGATSCTGDDITSSTKEDLWPLVVHL